MIYYRVPEKWDNVNRFKKMSDGKYKYMGCWVKNELYTESELLRLGFPGALKLLEKIEIPKSRIYWFFGCRFEIK